MLWSPFPPHHLYHPECQPDAARYRVISLSGLPGTRCRCTFLRDSDAPRRSHLDSYRLRHHLYPGSHHGISGPPHDPPRLRKHLWYAVWKHGNPMALNYANDTLPGDNPAVSYATVYPLSMFSRVIIAQLILMFLYNFQP